MANFETACKWLRMGKKITRPVWEDHSYWKLGVDEIIEYADGNRAVIHLNQFNADDWKIYKEEFCLSDKIVDLEEGDTITIKERCSLIHTKDVKEFIRMIEFWAHIDLGKQTLTIDYDKFKELVGSNLSNEKNIQRYR